MLKKTQEKEKIESEIIARIGQQNYQTICSTAFEIVCEEYYFRGQNKEGKRFLDDIRFIKQHIAEQLYEYMIARGYKKITFTPLSREEIKKIVREVYAESNVNVSNLERK